MNQIIRYGALELTKKRRGKILQILLQLLWALLVFFGALVYCSACWCIRSFGDVGFEAILFTMLNGAETAEGSIFIEYLTEAFIPCLIVAVLLLLTLNRLAAYRTYIRLTINKRYKLTLFPLPVGVSVVCLSAVLLFKGTAVLGIVDWLSMKSKQTTIYQDEYVEPSRENVIFEGEKRNLIYIYLESMENAFFSTEEGGARPYNVIPELYKLAESNINFSQNDSVGGGMDIGATWTIGAMTAQTSGLPLLNYYAPDTNRNTVGQKYPFLPGTKTLCNILHDNGYYQTLMVGSNSAFGGRQQLYMQHGADKMYDLFTAREDGLIAPDYKVWWGFEDKYLFAYAKQELLKIAKQEQPFAFTMLTVDTHRYNGYVCELCQEEYEEQYENVLACSSRQVYEFVQWLQEQDFYKNTTIIITGDHTTMDGEYIKRNVPSDYVRRVYNCVINPAVASTNVKNRVFTTMDMFPTTLSAMGATIKGDRLGLGTDLFSETPTLMERMGMEWLAAEIKKHSDYYITHFATKGE